VLVWRDRDTKLIHTAKVHQAFHNEKGRLLDSTVMRSKNGVRLFKERITLKELVATYGSKISAYRQLAPVNEDDESDIKINSM